jgi:hypothetical protein
MECWVGQTDCHYLHLYQYIWYVIYIWKEIWTLISLFPARKYVYKIWRGCLSHYTSRLLCVLGISAISIFNVATLYIYIYIFMLCYSIFEAKLEYWIERSKLKLFIYLNIIPLTIVWVIHQSIEAYEMYQLHRSVKE